MVDAGQASPPSDRPEQLMSVREVGQRLGVGTQWVYRHAGQLGAVKVGRSVKFSERGVRRYIERRSLSRLTVEGR